MGKAQYMILICIWVNGQMHFQRRLVKIKNINKFMHSCFYPKIVILYNTLLKMGLKLHEIFCKVYVIYHRNDWTC